MLASNYLPPSPCIARPWLQRKLNPKFCELLTNEHSITSQKMYIFNTGLKTSYSAWGSLSSYASQHSAAEMMEALQTILGDNDLTPYSPHLAPWHFWLNPRLKLGFWVNVLWHLQTSDANQQQNCTPHRRRLFMSAAKHAKTLERVFYSWILKTFWETWHMAMEAALEEININEASPHAVKKGRGGEGSTPKSPGFLATRLTPLDFFLWGYVNNLTYHLCGSHHTVLLNKVCLRRRTQHRFLLLPPYMYATCFIPFSGHV